MVILGHDFFVKDNTEKKKMKTWDDVISNVGCKKPPTGPNRTGPVKIRNRAASFSFDDTKRSEIVVLFGHWMKLERERLDILVN